MAENNSITVTHSQKFVQEVQRQYMAEFGDTKKFDDHASILTQHLFLKADTVLKEHKINWQNINIQKFALEAVYKISLNLDALLPNFIHIIPFKDGQTQKYNLVTMVGYAGKSYYRQQFALKKPKNIVYELVYSTDKFKPIKKSLVNPVESYEFEITNAFSRGECIGGFGYIEYDDPSQNKLIIVTADDFKKSATAARSNAFWGKWPIEMKLKTVIHRVADKIEIDPCKINKSFVAVENEELNPIISDENVVDIDIDGYSVTPDQETEQIPEPEAPADNPEPDTDSPENTQGKVVPF